MDDAVKKEMPEAYANLAVIIMAGGAGTRFWPVSTSDHPKQFINLLGGRTLLQQSFDRVRGIVPPERIFVLTSRSYTALTAEQLPELPAGHIIGEPCRRDTAAAVALASLLCRRLFGDDCVMAVLTSDHRIEPVSLFQKTLLSAAGAAAKSNALYTLGIKPSYPATGYGYLELGDNLENDPEGPAHFSLLRFKEKPQIEDARRFVESGRFLWNSGMFVWRAGSILGEFERQLPEHISTISPAAEAFGTAGWEEELEKAFEPLRKVSIDYAVMEHALDARTVESSFTWQDMGDWIAAAPFLDGDENGNRFRGPLYAFESHGNVVFTDEPDRSIALVGVENMAVISAGGKTMIVPLERLNEVKKLVEMLPADLR